MQNQDYGQDMKSRNQNPDPNTDPQAAQMNSKKKNQGQQKKDNNQRT